MTDVHDLHIWMLSVGRHIVTVHMKAVDTEFVRLSCRVGRAPRGRFPTHHSTTHQNHPPQAMREAQALFVSAGIDHITIQMQKDDCLPDECDHPCVSVACTSHSPGGSPGGCTYV